MVTKIKKIVNYAYENVKYYHELYNNYQNMIESDFTLKQFRQLPFVDKKMLYLDKTEILSKNRNQETSVIVKTSGTTGQCITAHWNQSDFNRSMLELWLMRKKYGISTTDKCCRFFTNMYIGNSLVKESVLGEIVNDGRMLMISKSNLTEERLMDVYLQILEYQPAWLYLQPSVAQLLLRTKEKEKLESINSLRYIELTGEAYLPELEKRLEKEFSCKVCNMYGMIEVNGIAYGESGSKLKILKSNVFVEIVRENKVVSDGEIGEICITSLNNYQMPLIRYLTGDFGYLKDGDLYLLKGRKSEYIKLSREEVVPVYVLFSPIERINGELGDIITDARFVQNAFDKIEVLLVVKNEYLGWIEEIQKLFLRYIAKEKRLKAVNWKFMFASKLDDLNNGKKIRFFYSNLQED